MFAVVFTGYLALLLFAVILQGVTIVMFFVFTNQTEKTAVLILNGSCLSACFYSCWVGLENCKGTDFSHWKGQSSPELSCGLGLWRPETVLSLELCTWLLLAWHSGRRQEAGARFLSFRVGFCVPECELSFYTSSVLFLKDMLTLSVLRRQVKRKERFVNRIETRPGFLVFLR